MKMKRALRITLFAILVLLVIAAVGFVIWGSTPQGPGDIARQALVSDSLVQVEETSQSWIVFTPVGAQPDTGFIFYPGGHVEYRSYAPALRQIASAGYKVVLVPMPFSLAVLDSGKAADVIESYPDIEYWAIGGHSLGGSMAASFAAGHPDQVKGLVLWASYPPTSNDLSQTNLRVVSIYGSLDGVLNRVSLENTRGLLPKATTFIEIQGGNHAQFGDYGLQAGDNTAEISPEKQQEAAAQAAIQMLRQLAENK